MAELANGPPAESVDRAERLWAYVVTGVVAFVFAVIIFTGVHWAAHPPSNVETIDASRLHLSGEFMEANIGSAMQPDGSAIVRVIAQQYSFVPQCIVVPAGTPVVFRVTTPDVVHGFLIAGPNVNSMVVPGFVAEVRTRFDRPGEHVMPCHEYCSVGHEDMWARVRVVDRFEYARAYGGQQRAYLEEQPQAFKAGRRHNDISEQMRSVARALTGEEIAQLAAYYSSLAKSSGR